MPSIVTSGLPYLETALSGLTVEDLKWYTAFLPEKTPKRKAELVAAAETDAARPGAPAAALGAGSNQPPAGGRRGGPQPGWALQRRGSAREVSPMCPRHRGHISATMALARRAAKSMRRPTTCCSIAAPMWACPCPAIYCVLLRDFVPEPPTARMRSHDEHPGLPTKTRFVGFEPDFSVSETERAIFHDLTATLHLVQQGKVGVSAATRHADPGHSAAAAPAPAARRLL